MSAGRVDPWVGWGENFFEIKIFQSAEKKLKFIPMLKIIYRNVDNAHLSCMSCYNKTLHFKI